MCILPRDKNKTENKKPAHKFRIRKGTQVLYKGQRFSVLKLTDSFATMKSLDDGNDDKKTVAHRDDLKPLKQDAIKKSPPPIVALNDKQWEIAANREEIIKASGTVKEKSIKHNVPVSTIYRWIKRFEEGGCVCAALAPRHPSRRKDRLSEEVEDVIQVSYEKHYLNKQQKTVNKAYLKVKDACEELGLPCPCEDTVRRRINDIDDRKKITARRGHKEARDKYALVQGQFPNADFPLSVIQLDHTRVDLMIVDSVNRLPIGKPWITLAIDVRTRVIVGLYISLEPPSVRSVAQVIYHAVMKKDEELEALGISGEWPAYGLMSKIHCDNAREFRSNSLKRACKNYGITLEWRPRATPHYGGHIERMLGTIAKEIHALPGTTFSNVAQKGEYKSEEKATLSLNDLRMWLTEWVVNTYHRRRHRTLETSPLAEWKNTAQGLHTPAPVQNPDRFKLDFMPYTMRKVTREGITWDKIFYNDPVLSAFIGRKEKFLVRRDPYDISKLYLLDKDNGIYHTIPYADTSLPAISLWEYRAAKKRLKDRGRDDDDGDVIIRSAKRLAEIEEGAEITTRSSRKLLRNNERRNDIQNKAEPNQSSPKTENQFRDLVVDNTKSYEGDDNDEYIEFTDKELEEGVLT